MAVSDQLKCRPALIAVAGASGIGKTTIIDSLIALYRNSYRRPRSYTTRTRRSNEENTEYAFRSIEQMSELFTNGSLLTLDEAYGNLYGIDKADCDLLFEQGVCPVKEIHPKNHSDLRASVPRMISVLLAPGSSRIFDSRVSAARGRLDADRRCYENIDFARFDIVLRIPESLDAGRIAVTLHANIQAHLHVPDQLPRESAKTRAGYERLAPEFEDSLRMTTRNFHQLGRGFVQASLLRACSKQAICLEVGPGTGWARRSLNWPSLRYLSSDVAFEMSRRNAGQRVVADNERLPFRSCSFDCVLASLADPYCQGPVLCELRRVLKRSGRLILTAPSSQWALRLRGESQKDATTFVLKDGTPIGVSSYTYTIAELRELLEMCGYSVNEALAATNRELDRNEAVSPAISKVLHEGATLDLLNMIDATPRLEWEG